MAKKSQTNSRRNNTQAGRRVVNFYNNGTVNIDARQNRSHTHKTENNGCTINYPYHTAGNMGVLQNSPMKILLELSISVSARNFRLLIEIFDSQEV